jgi:hypothetical protein
MAKTFEIGNVARDAPIRLSTAAAVAFPDGSMTASGLRREALRGRLVTERIAGKDYTTLAHIERMRELCRVEVKERDQPVGSSAEMKDHLPLRTPDKSPENTHASPQNALRARLEQNGRLPTQNNS